MRSLYFGAAGLLLLWWAVLWVAQRAILFPTPDPGRFRLPDRPGDAILVELPSAEGPTEAWLLPALGRRAGPAPLLLFAHGNGELIDFWAEPFVEPRRWGVGVLLVEYPGYGRSAGSPSERSIVEAMVAAWDWAAARPEVDGGRIVGYGRSVGGGAVAGLAHRRPLAGLILESSFTSAASFATRFGAPPFLVRDPFDVLGSVREFEGPVLVLHGERDRVIPTAHGRRLAAAAGTELELLPCGHNDCPRPWDRLRRWLVGHGLAPGGRD